MEYKRIGDGVLWPANYGAALLDLVRPGKHEKNSLTAGWEEVVSSCCNRAQNWSLGKVREREIESRISRACVFHSCFVEIARATKTTLFFCIVYPAGTYPPSPLTNKYTLIFTQATQNYPQTFSLWPLRTPVDK